MLSGNDWWWDAPVHFLLAEDRVVLAGVGTGSGRVVKVRAAGLQRRGALRLDTEDGSDQFTHDGTTNTGVRIGHDVFTAMEVAATEHELEELYAQARSPALLACRGVQ